MTKSASPKYIKKFAAQLGTAADFVAYVRKQESLGKLADLDDFRGTNGTWAGKRYLMVKRGGVIDFRHFFAAMTQRLTGTHSKKVSIGSTSEGTTLLLGVLNEVGQCVQESAKLKLNSCFSKEDLISNRLGANFGELIVIKRSEANSNAVANHLNTYLAKLGPIPATKISKLKVPSKGEVLVEAAGAVLQSLADILIPSAY